MTQDRAVADALPQPLRILLVCEANHCRSPLAEHLLRHAMRWHPQLHWQVGSAGVHAPDGVPAHPHVVRVLKERGITSTGWVSRSLTPQLVDESDLVLTAELAQRRHIVRMQPTAVAKTFPLRAFGAWLRQSPTGGSGTVLERGLAGRAQSQPIDPREQELADPLGHSLRRFRACARLLDETLKPFVG